MPGMRRTVIAALVGALGYGAAPALAQDRPDIAWPERQVKLVMPFAPGGMGDTLARLLAAQLAKEWKQPVVVENKAGASGMIGNDLVAKSAPDGYTLLMGISQLVQAPSLYPRLPYDVMKDFTPLVRVAGAVSIFATTDPQIQSLKDYIALASKSPGKYSYGSYGAGTSSQIFAEIFNGTNRLQVNHVPYKGAAPLLNDMMAGHVPLSFSDLATALPFIQSGRVRIHAVTGARRSAALPNVPTFAEQGYPGMEMVGWYGTFGPAKMPKEIVDKIRGTIERVIRQPEFQAKLTGFGLEPVSGPPEDFAQKMQSDLAYWKRAVDQYNIRIEP